MASKYGEYLGRINQFRNALIAAKEKLELYRAAHSGEFIGGVEYTTLMRQIDYVLNLKD